MKKIILAFIMCISVSFFNAQDYSSAGIKKSMSMAMFHSYKNFNTIKGDLVQDQKGDKYYLSKHVIGGYGKAYIVEFANGNRVYFQSMKLSDLENAGKIMLGVIETINFYVKQDGYSVKESKEGDFNYTDLYNTQGKRVFTLSTSHKHDLIQFTAYVHTIF